MSFDGTARSRWEKLEVFLGPEVFSRIVLLEDKSNVSLDLMIYFDECFEWRFEVEWKFGRDEVLSWKILEVVSNLDRAKWGESNELEETHLINKEEVLKIFWAFSLEVEPWVESKEGN